MKKTQNMNTTEPNYSDTKQTKQRITRNKNKTTYNFSQKKRDKMKFFSFNTRLISLYVNTASN